MIWPGCETDAVVFARATENRTIAIPLSNLCISQVLTLSKGGFIFVHDYNNRRYMGVRDAVDAFLRNSGAVAMPLPDFAGSIVIAK